MAGANRLGSQRPDALFGFHLYAGAAPDLQQLDRLRRAEELVVKAAIGPVRGSVWTLIETS